MITSQNAFDNQELLVRIEAVLGDFRSLPPQTIAKYFDLSFGPLMDRSLEAKIRNMPPLL